ncbi:MAG TPA: hypothetical protein VIQ53_14570 [Inquilinus sp.]
MLVVLVLVARTQTTDPWLPGTSGTRQSDHRSRHSMLVIVYRSRPAARRRQGGRRGLGDRVTGHAGAFRPNIAVRLVDDLLARQVIRQGPDAYVRSEVGSNAWGFSADIDPSRFVFAFCS